MSGDLTGLDKAAILLMNLENSDAAAIIKYLTSEQIRKLGITMSKLSNLDNATVESVMLEYISGVDENYGDRDDDPSFTEELIRGPKSINNPESVSGSPHIRKHKIVVNIFKGMESTEIIELIKGEHPQIQAIMLTLLEPGQAADILSYIDIPRLRSELIIRIAKLHFIHPNAINEINNLLGREVVKSGVNVDQNIDGVRIAANILNNVNSTIESRVIDDIQIQNPQLGINIQDSMFAFANLLDLESNGLQILLREISKESLILALKGADASIKKRIFESMSKKEADSLASALSQKGPVKISDVEKSQKEILDVAKRLGAAGVLTSSFA